MDREKIIDEDGYIVAFKQMSFNSNNNDTDIKLIACGDIGPVRNLERVVLTRGPDWILGDVKEELKRGDIVFANLEAPYSNRGKPLNRIPTFRLDTAAFSIIKAANIDVVSLANNHIFDYGFDAFDDTVDLLKRANIEFFGAGKNVDEAEQPAIMKIKDVTFGFIGFGDIELSIENFPRGITPPGVVPQMRYEKVKKAIKKLRPTVDWIILSLHFGWEYELYPSPKDVMLCRNFIHEGVDIILGHHPHYPQGIERYKNGLIVYSLGNFIFDQSFIGHTCSSYILEVNLGKNEIHNVRVLPFQLSNQYRLKIPKDNTLIGELNLISSDIKDENALEKKWYFICRNKCLLSLIDLRDVISKYKLKGYFIMIWIRSMLHPRSRYTWKSLLGFCLSGKALKFEIEKKIAKMGG